VDGEVDVGVELDVVDGAPVVVEAAVVDGDEDVDEQAPSAAPARATAAAEARTRP
jgi:hypothetical protein